MTASLDRRDPLVGDPGDPGLTGLRDAFLRARVRDTTVRLSLAMFRARGYAEVWGRDDDARRWAQTAAELRTELDGLQRQLDDDGADGANRDGADRPYRDGADGWVGSGVDGPVEVPEAPRSRLA
ncbi:hypothetical protein [Cellulomonas sp. SG140]|uniref:hypothetical protein n=1 Tax=Cellulomonas sp. SG140 TaxID=2976536 RepID=UPI0021E8CDFB|nr:hypothetical protein [Cellulomonas sp. SG140]